ncbi:hypothetical protein K8R43_02255 [archaeon]|nr:hypothetical protein [archaeon]
MKKKGNAFQLSQKVKKFDFFLGVLGAFWGILLFALITVREFSDFLYTLPSPFGSIIGNVIFLGMIPIIFAIAFSRFFGLTLERKALRDNSPSKEVYHPGDQCPNCSSIDVIIRKNEKNVVIQFYEAICMHCNYIRKVSEKDKKRYDVPCPVCHSKDKCFTLDGYHCAQCGKSLKNRL